MKKKTQNTKIDIPKSIKRDSRKTKIPVEKTIPDKRKELLRKKEKYGWKKDIEEI